MFDEELILLGEDGENILSRNTRLAFKVSGKIWVNNHAHVLRPKNGYDIDFLTEYLESLDYTQYNSGTAQPKLNKQTCKNILVVEPAMKEQRAIAEALGDVDGLIAGLERLIAKKRAVKTAVMQQLLTGKTRLPGFERPWENTQLQNVAMLSKDSCTPANHPDKQFVHFSLPAFDEEKSPVFETGVDIGSNKYTIPKQAILLSKLNPRISRVWMPNVIPENSIASTEFLVLVPKPNITREFLFAVLVSQEFRAKMESAITGTTGSHQRVRPTDALELEFRMPTEKAEQQAIAEVIIDIDAEISALEKRRDKTKAIKQGMMQELLTGRTRLVGVSAL